MNAITQLRPIPGLADADTVLAASIAKRTTLKARLAEAEAALAHATKRRDVLVARAGAGEVVPPAESAEVQTAIRDAEAAAGIARDAMPNATAEFAAAEAAVTRVLGAEARRLHEAALARKAKADAAAAEANAGAHAAGKAAAEAQAFIARAGVRDAWGGRVPRLPGAAGRTSAQELLDEAIAFAEAERRAGRR